MFDINYIDHDHFYFYKIFRKLTAMLITMGPNTIHWRSLSSNQHLKVTNKTCNVSVSITWFDEKGWLDRWKIPRCQICILIHLYSYNITWIFRHINYLLLRFIGITSSNSSVNYCRNNRKAWSMKINQTNILSTVYQPQWLDQTKEIWCTWSTLLIKDQINLWKCCASNENSFFKYESWSPL